MKNFSQDLLFKKTSRPAKNIKPLSGRSLKFEPLEERQLLAVSYQLFTNEQCTTPGLTGSYVNSSLQNDSSQDDWRTTQTIAGTRIDNPPTFTGNDWGNRASLNLTGGTDADWDYFAVQWDGYIKITQPTSLATWSDDGSRMWIDVNKDGTFDSSGQEFVNNGWGQGQSATVGDSSVVLREGTYKIRIQYNENNGGNVFALQEATPDLGMAGIAVDSKGNIINVESATNTVSVYDSQGKLKFAFGSTGSGDGQFNGPRDVTVDQNDNIYVADTGNNRIQVFDSTGKFLRSFDASATQIGKLKNPEGLYYDAKINQLYVADTGNHRIMRFNSAGLLDTTFGYNGVVGTTGQAKHDHLGFDTPTAVAVHPTTGEVYIADKINSRIEVYSATGNYARSYLSVFQPEDIEFLVNGDLLIVGDDVMPGREGYINAAYSGRLRVLRNGSEFTTAMYHGGIDDLGDKISGVAVKKDGTIVIADENNGRLVVAKPKTDSKKAFPDDLSFVEPVTDLNIETYGNKVTITWKTASPSPSYLQWGTDKNAMTGSVSDLKLKTNHSLTITGLEAQSLLYYQIGFKDTFNENIVRWTQPDKINSGVPDDEKLVLRLKAVGLVWADKDDKAGSISLASDEEIEKIKQLYRDLSIFVWQNTGFNVWIDFVAMPVYTGDYIRDGNPKSNEDILKEFGFSAADDLDLVLDTSICWGGAGGGVGGSGGMFDRGIGWSYQEWDDGRTIVHEVNHIFDFAVYGWHDVAKYEGIHCVWSIQDVVGGDRSCNAQVYDNLYTANYTATGGDFAKWIVVPDADRDGLPDDSPTDQGLVTPLPITEKTLKTSPLKKDTDDDGISDFDEARYFPYGGIDPTANDTDDDGIKDGNDLNAGYPIGDNIKKNAPEIDGRITENDGWTIITDHWGYENTFGAWDNNEYAQDVVTAMSWDDEYMYFAIEYKGWGYVDVLIDGSCDNWYYGLDTYGLRLHSWNEAPEVVVYSGLQDMHMQVGAEYGDLYTDDSDRFRNPYNGRPIADNDGDGLGITERLVNPNDVIFVKKYNSATGVYTWEVAIPWSPDVTGLVGYDQKIVGIDISVCGDKLFNTDTYAKIKFVDEQVKSLSMTANKTAVEEGEYNAVAFTVTRTGDISQALELTVTSSDTGELTVPKTVTIPAGQKSATFYGSTLDDKIRDGSQTVTVTVSAAGFPTVSTEIIVLDIASSEVILESLTLPQVAMQGSMIDLSWLMKNIGTAPTMGQWSEKIYISPDSSIAGGQMVYDNISTTVLDAGSYLNRSASVTLPGSFSDQCYVIIELTWEGKTITLVSDPIRIQRYSLTLTADKTSVLEGQKNAVTFTVTRTGDQRDELVLQIMTDKDGELIVPQTVTLPAGAASATFQADSFQDYIKDGDQRVRVSLTLKGETLTSAAVTVLDVAPADLIVDDWNVPTVVRPKSTFDISWVIKNIGQLETNKAWVENVYISFDAEPGNDLILLTSNPNQTIGPDKTANRLQSVTLPNEVDRDFWFVFEIVYDGVTHRVVSDKVILFATTLSLSSNRTSAPEGEKNVFTFTVTRSGNTDNSQLVTITSSDGNELSLPRSVTIPAGQSSTTFYGTTLQDNIRDGNKPVTVTVAIEDLASDSLQVLVVDVVPADLQVSDLVLPDNIYTGSACEISWLLKNVGDLPRTQFWTERILLSTDNRVGNDVTLLSETVNMQLNGGESTKRTANVVIPEGTMGNRWIIVQTIFDGQTRNLVSEMITIGHPKLTLVANIHEIEEGVENGIQFTVSRGGDLSKQLEATITVSVEGELAVPGKVVFYEGESLAFFRGSGIQDNVADGNKKVTVTVSANGLAGASLDILVLDTSGDKTLETLTMPNSNVNHWTVRRNGNRLLVRNAQQQVILEKPLSQLLGLIVNTSDSHDDTLAVDLSGGVIELEQGLVFNGNVQNVNAIKLLGTEDDDSFEFRNATAKVNGLDVTWQHIKLVDINGGDGFDYVLWNGTNGNDQFQFENGTATLTTSDTAIKTVNVDDMVVDGLGGSDTAMIVGTKTNGIYSLDADSFVMQAGGQRVEVNGFNRINAFADASNDMTYVYGRSNARVFMSEQYVERRGKDQVYRIWHSEQVDAVNSDETNNTIVHTGSRAFDLYALDNGANKIAGTATNANGSYHHQWDGFAEVTISSSTAEAQTKFYTTIDTTLDKTTDLAFSRRHDTAAMITARENELWLACLAEEQQKSNAKKAAELFEDVENLLDDFEQLALQELLRGAS